LYHAPQQAAYFTPVKKGGLRRSENYHETVNNYKRVNFMRSNILRCFLIIGFSIIFIAADLRAATIGQSVGIASSPNPVGSGARAVGMGGAFIGVADDATAASWNPAGLIQLETPELSVVGAYVSRSEDFYSSLQPEINRLCIPLCLS
jgi:hypothetical protein